MLRARSTARESVRRYVPPPEASAGKDYGRTTPARCLRMRGNLIGSGQAKRRRHGGRVLPVRILPTGHALPSMRIQKLGGSFQLIRKEIRRHARFPESLQYHESCALFPCALTIAFFVHVGQCRFVFHPIIEEGTATDTRAECHGSPLVGWSVVELDVRHSPHVHLPIPSGNGAFPLLPMQLTQFWTVIIPTSCHDLLT